LLSQWDHRRSAFAELFVQLEEKRSHFPDSHCGVSSPRHFNFTRIGWSAQQTGQQVLLWRPRNRSCLRSWLRSGRPWRSRNIWHNRPTRFSRIATDGAYDV